jgi:hypothetical protein
VGAALQPFVAVASVLLRFVLLFPRIRRLNVSTVTASPAAGHNSRQYPSLLSAASAVDHGLPDGASETCSGSDGYALKSRKWWIAPPERSPSLASPESVGAATGFLTARRQGRTRTGAAVVIRRDEHLHRETGLVATDETARTDGQTCG